ncbi:MAG TPA: hypothetical protein VH062_19795 [Polyangiaceae bacterium]|nr:hypothetical protein [Polyangiaceae bacterium]
MNRLLQRCAALVAGGVAFASLRFEARPVRADAPPPVVDLWTFGRNNVGQLGGVPSNTTIPGPLHEARHWVAVSGGTQHTLALTAEGEVFAWGANASGQLGNGTTTDSVLPVQVTGLTGVTLIAAGGAHSFAYRASDATLWGWGDNSQGNIAQPESVASSPTPVVITGTGPLTAISGGGSHGLALGTDGTVYAWGSNVRGQLGLGDTAIRWSPTAVPLTAPAIAIGAGLAHSIAVTRDDGQAWTWGWNVFGQLGNGLQGAPMAANPTPAKALGVVGVDQVSGGDFHSLARTTDGHVFAWGYNTEGQVGIGDETPADTGVLTPVLLPGIDSVAKVDAGGIHSIALRTNGEAWAWGNNQYGATGINARGNSRVPVPVFGHFIASDVTAGGYHCVALSAPRPLATVVELGDATASVDPVTLPLLHDESGPSDVTALVAGAHHVLALDADHRVWSWGDDSAGQLGTPDGSHDAPELVDVPLEGAAGIAQIAARANQSFALRSDGAVFAWGDNTYAALGIGDGALADHPTRVTGLAHIVRVAAGDRHGLALDQNGTVWSWGQNLAGELGTRPSATLMRTPAQIPGVSGVTFIAAGAFHNATIDLVGTALMWGDGSHAQLGNGGIAGSFARVAAALSVPDVVTLSLGRFSTLALRAGGSVWSYGDASACQLGPGTVPGIWTPMSVTLPVSVTAIAAGDYHGLALGTDGNVYGWGDDSRGALGVPGPSYSHLVCDAVVAGTAPALLMAAGGAFSAVGISR